MRIVLGRLCWQYATIEVTEEEADQEAALLERVSAGALRVAWEPPTGYSEDVEELIVVGPDDSDETAEERMNR